ncbi:MAG: hypothetical protein MK106_01220 [Mariniblastus sp.]|nr:hypothetical protein [Mariniblastus sp.]
MTQRIHTPDLTSAKPRCGLQSVSSILPRLIAFYECQADARRQIEGGSLLMERAESPSGRQGTFAFYR